MNRDRTPFDDDRTPPPFEIDEDALRNPGPFWDQPAQEHAAPQPTKVLPTADPVPADAPTQRLSALPGEPPRRGAAPPPMTPSYGNSEYTELSSGHLSGHDERGGSELGPGGWLRLVIGGPLLLAAAWLLLHGAHAVLGGDGLDTLLNPFTLVGAPLLLGGILLLPGPGGGKVAAVVLAAVAYGAMLAPTLLQPVGAFNSTLTAFVFAPTCALFGFMTWLSARGKRPAAWLLIVLPPATAILVALLVAATPVSVLLRGDALADLDTITALLPDAARRWLLALPTEIAQSTIRFAALALCVVPAMLIAGPVRKPR